jgi:ribonuclease HI
MAGVFDAAFIPDRQDGAYGYVIRNEISDFVATGAGKIHHLRTALHAEAEACLIAIEAAANLGIYHVIFNRTPSLWLMQSGTEGMIWRTRAS